MTLLADVLDAYARIGWHVLLLALIAACILGAVAYLSRPLVAPDGYDEPPTADDEWAMRGMGGQW